MTFVLAALRDKPQGLFLMDDTSPLQDYSGYGRTAVLNGTLVKHSGLVKGAAYAPVLNATTVAEMYSNVFKQNEEEKSFTLAAWFRVVTGTGEQQVLGNDNQMDGLTVNGTTVSFVIKYATAPETRLSFELQDIKTVAAWAVHTESKNMLFINGILVDEAEVTNEQQVDTFASTSANLFSGDTAGTQTLAVNALGLYNFALTPYAIARQYRAGVASPTYENVVSSFGGNILPVSNQNVSPYIDVVWENTEDWNKGYLSNVAVADNELVPQFDVDTSVPGTWYDTVPLSNTDASTIYGVVIDWLGDGFTVDVSLDGTVWSAVSRNRKIALVPQGFDPTDEVLLVRVSFAGGVLNDESHLTRLSVIGIESDTGQAYNGRTITYNNATPTADGVYVNTGGSVVISADASGAPIRSVEMWVTPDGADSTLAVGGAASTMRQNGPHGPTTSTVKNGHRTLLHRALNADATGTVSIAFKGHLEHLAVYDRALTVSEITAVYDAYSGTNSARVTDTSVITLTESADAADIYAYDWAITGSG